ncbi:hypothetical protein [Pilimelia columellifera]|uniref:Uncharacterized protein n=1 Tax=Pilimelia columellifera subsp. columellifera TaxID=706583 RepID=A0ABP6AVX7_9ACTN
MSGAELIRVVDQLAGQTAQWTAARWDTPPEAGGPSRAEIVHALVQRIADLAAEAEGEPRRELPAPDRGLLLPDQLRVVANDLVASGASELLTHAAAADVSEVRASL